MTPCLFTKAEGATLAGNGLFSRKPSKGFPCNGHVVIIAEIDCIMNMRAKRTQSFGEFGGRCLHCQTSLDAQKIISYLQ